MYHLSRLDVQRPPIDASSAPYFSNSPEPGWGLNPAAAGPLLVGVGCAGGCGCGGGCNGIGVDEPAPPETGTPSWLGYAALAAAGGLVIGLVVGYAAGQNAPRGRYRANAAKVISIQRRRRYKIPKGSRPGSGVRFRALTHHLAKRPGIRRPKALAAYIGRKKYGKAKFQQMAAAGRRRSYRRRAAA